MAHGLIIEDKPEVRRSIAGYVKAGRHTYDEAGSLEDARSKLEANAYEFMLLDLSIPYAEGDSAYRDLGIECLKDIRASKLNGNTAVVVVTSDEDRELAMDVKAQIDMVGSY